MGKRKPPNTSLMLDPIKIAFSQDSISFKFTNGTLLSTAITKLVRGTLKIAQFPPIRVFHFNNTWYSLDNRRLYVFKEAAKKGVFTQVPVIDTPSTEIRRNEIDAKLTTLNAGRQVTIRGTVARTVTTTRCHYCLKECQTAGHLSLHCQEDHLEEYKEEAIATTQTIDQFLMSKRFVIKDDLLISLEHLQVETDSERQLLNCASALSREFQSSSHVKCRETDVTQCKWKRTLDLQGCNENRKDEMEINITNTTQTESHNKPSSKDSTELKKKQVLRDSTALKKKPVIKEITELKKNPVLKDSSELKKKQVLKDSTELKNKQVLKDSTELKKKPVLKNSTELKKKQVLKDSTELKKKPVLKDSTALKNKLFHKGFVMEAVKRGPIEKTFWQSTDKLNQAEVYISNLFIKVLHYRDAKYPLS